MASLTVRQLDEKLKKLLRLRAARHGRSMEDEVRVILRQAAEEAGLEALDLINPPNPPAQPVTQQVRTAAAAQKRVLLIIGGGIAAYKSLDLIRRLQDRGARVRCILTAAAAHFVTPLAVGALAGERAYTDLFDAQSEFDVGHIRMARDTDLIVVAPATADLIAKMASGQADDLATAVLLATDKPILLAPAMNPHMWTAKATQRNLARLRADGVQFIGPNAGEMAERGEAGLGRMAEPLEIAAAADAMLRSEGLLAGKRVLGHVRADQRTARSGARARQPFVGQARPRHCGGGRGRRRRRDAGQRSGRSAQIRPACRSCMSKRRARCWRQWKKHCRRILPFSPPPSPTGGRSRRARARSRSKAGRRPSSWWRTPTSSPPSRIASPRRPPLVVGFAAETDNVIANAKAKLARKGCDWIVANDVSPATGIMGGDSNTVHLVTADAVENWPPQSKEDVARALIARIAATLQGAER